MAPLSGNGPMLPASITCIMLLFMHRKSIPKGLASQAFGKPNKQFPTYNLIQKIWNKTKQLQRVLGFAKYSPVQHNGTCEEPETIQQGTRWRQFWIPQHHIFKDGVLLPFFTMHESFTFEYALLLHKVETYSRSTRICMWVGSVSHPCFQFNLVC